MCQYLRSCFGFITGHIMSNVGEPCGTGDMKFIGTCKEGLQCSDGWCDNATIAYESDAGDANDKKDRRWLSSYRYYNWMSRVSSSKKLSEMSIPGTHDSMTGDTSIGSHTNWCTKIPVNTCCACQSASLWSQLASGIRFLDIRLRCYNNKMWLYHGSISLGMDFKSVLSTIRKFLRYYPSETVIMSYQRDHADYKCGRGFKRQFQSELGSYMIYAGSRSGITLGNARGKIVPLDFKNNGGKGLKWWTNWRTSTLENDWEDVTRRMYYYKISLEGNLQESMGKTSSTYKTVFFITYFSANDCAFFPYGTKGPSYIARRVNPNLQNWIYWKNRSLRGSGRTNYGIVAMDFPSRYLTGQILQNN